MSARRSGSGSPGRSAAASRRSPAGSRSSARVVDRRRRGRPRGHGARRAGARRGHRPVRRRASGGPTAASTGRRSAGSCSPTRRRLRDLEAIVHPAVRPRILAALRADEDAGAPVVVIEAIKLVEGGLADAVRRGLARDVRRRRSSATGCSAAARTPADADRRIAAQGDLVERLRPAATRVIDTSGDPASGPRVAVVAAWARRSAAAPERQQRVGHPARGGGPGGREARRVSGAAGEAPWAGARDREAWPAATAAGRGHGGGTQPRADAAGYGAGLALGAGEEPGSATGSAPGSGSGRCRAGRSPGSAGRTWRSAFVVSPSFDASTVRTSASGRRSRLNWRCRPP